jgi:hypothetical protein
MTKVCDFNHTRGFGSSLALILVPSFSAARVSAQQHPTDIQVTDELVKQSFVALEYAKGRFASKSFRRESDGTKKSLPNLHGAKE